MLSFFHCIYLVCGLHLAERFSTVVFTLRNPTLIIKLHFAPAPCSRSLLLLSLHCTRLAFLGNPLTGVFTMCAANTSQNHDSCCFTLHLANLLNHSAVFTLYEACTWQRWLYYYLCTACGLCTTEFFLWSFIMHMAPYLRYLALAFLYCMIFRQCEIFIFLFFIQYLAPSWFHCRLFCNAYGQYLAESYRMLFLHYIWVVPNGIMLLLFLLFAYC